jgi:hypothetical protein
VTSFLPHSSLLSLKASVWKHFTTTITQQLHYLDPNYSHYHSNPTHPSAQILNRLRAGQQSNFPRHPNPSTPNAGILPVPILPNGQYPQGSQAGTSRRYPIPTPVPMPIPGLNGAQQQRGRQAWEQMSTGFAAHSLARPGQVPQQNSGTALLNATQQAYPQLVSHYFNSPQAAQASQNIATQVTNHVLQLQQQQQQILSTKEMKTDPSSKEMIPPAEPSGRNQSTAPPSTRQQQMSQGSANQTKQSSTVSQSSSSHSTHRKNQSSNSVSAVVTTSVAPSVAPAPNSNKRSMDDMKDYLALTSNQPEGLPTATTAAGEQEDFNDLKRLKLENSLRL